MDFLQRLEDLTKRLAETMALNARDVMNKWIIAELDRELNVLHNNLDSLSS